MPGQDLRQAIEDAMSGQGCEAAFVLSGIGSLSKACIRLAGVDAPRLICGDLELVTLAGSVAAGGAHLHATLATARGDVLGGHVAPGCIVRTTAEILLALLPEWRFSRAVDPLTGHNELVIRRKG